MRLLAAADWLSMFVAERIWSSYFSETRPMAPALLALVFRFNIKPIHSAVDMGNQSSTACKLFCIVCERLTYSTSLSFATCFAGRWSLLLIHILNDKHCRARSVGFFRIDLDLHCLQKQSISGFSRTRVNYSRNISADVIFFFFFIISPQKHMLWYSLEAPLWRASTVYPKHIISWRNKKNTNTTVEPQSLEHLWDHGNSFETWVVWATEG